MKLPLLLSQYLKEQNRLRLPGLGSFYSSGNAAAEGAASYSIRFEYGNAKQADDALIDFIKQNTGKIRPLAIADLECYIQDGVQLLNIGKPFYIEGIGTIQKNKEGQYDFVQRELSVAAADGLNMEASAPLDRKRSVFDDEKYEPPVNPWQKILVAVLLLGGLAIVVLGGYYLYSEKNRDVRVLQDSTPVQKQDSAIATPADSLSLPIDTSTSVVTYAANTATAHAPSTQPGQFKFVLETTKNKKRAVRRYNQLKSYFLPIQMESPDSSSYKLYFVIAATAADTTRIKDSLNRYYSSKVIIE